MRLHRVRLQNYRGVADCTVEFAADGVTIVEGDNEVGKTCIPESLDLILKVPDSSKAKQVLDVRPVHRDAGPEVEVELSSADYRFAYSKRWHRQPQTRLDIVEPRREQLTGREAHDRVREILDETLDRDLWEALCIEQGTEVALPLFDVPSLGRALDAAAGGESSGGRGDDLWDRICAERERYWTPTGQRPTERKAAERSVEEAREAVTEIEQQIAAIEVDAGEVQRRLDDGVRLAEASRCAERDEQDLGEQWTRVERLRDDVARHEANHRAAVAERDRIDGEWQRRAGLLEDVENRRRELDALEVEVEQAAPALAAVEVQATAASGALETVSEALRAARAVDDLAAADRDHRRQEIEVSQLDERRARVVAAQDALGAAEKHLETARVDADLLERIEKAHLDVVRAGAAADSAAAALEVTALSDMTVLLDGEEVVLPSGDTRRVAVGDETRLMLPDIVQLVVRAGYGSRDRAAELREAVATLDQLCALGSVTSLDEARRASGSRTEAERSRADAIATIQRDLRDLTLDVLVQKIEGLSRLIARYAAERPVDPPLPDTFEEAKKRVVEAKQALARQEADFDLCRTVAEDTGRRLVQAKQEEAVHAERIANMRHAMVLADERLAQARQERPDAELRASLAAAQQAVDGAAEPLLQVRDALVATDPDSLTELLANARATRERAEAAVRVNAERLATLRARLEVRGEEGLHGRLSEAEVLYRHLERSHERTESRAQAAQLLHETFAVRRAESRRRYVAPFAERIEQLGRIVFDPSFKVELDDDLRVVRRTLDGVTLEVDRLSVGAREQLGVLARLACAVIVSPDGGGAPVVLDDALGWSDPSRLARMGAAIATAGRECQVIVLTCTPGRYAHVGNATVVSLPT